MRDEASGVELSELRCRMRQEVGLTPPSPGTSAEHVGPAFANLG